MSDVVHADIIAKAVALGNTAADGIDSIVDLAELVFDQAKLGRLTKETSKLVYDAYNSASNSSDTAIKVATSKDSLKNSYSRLNQFVTLATCGNGNGWELATLAIDVRRELKAERDAATHKVNTKLASTYVSIVETARKLNALAKDGKSWDGIGKDAIREWIRPDAPDTSYAAIIKAAADRFDRLSEDTKTYTNVAERLAFGELAKAMRNMNPAALVTATA